MTYIDKNLTCHDCGTEFLFTAFEQEFYTLNSFSYEIECCRSCRQKRTQSVAATVYRGIPANRSPRPMRDTSCFGCGKTTAISFAPRFGKPVYCLDCYERFGRRHA